MRSCDQYVKDTIWKQFTTSLIGFRRTTSCDQYVKDTIWKQFTTMNHQWPPDKPLWPICQRYNLKAIHNNQVRKKKKVAVVTNMSKIQSESNSQLWQLCDWANWSCDQYVKDTIWKQFTTNQSLFNLGFVLWPICQRYNLKAIHNNL